MTAGRLVGESVGQWEVVGGSVVDGFNKTRFMSLTMLQKVGEVQRNLPQHETHCTFS